MVKCKSLTAIENCIHTILKMNQITFAYKNVHSHSTAGQFKQIGISWSINFSFIRYVTDLWIISREFSKKQKQNYEK